MLRRRPPFVGKAASRQVNIAPLPTERRRDERDDGGVSETVTTPNGGKPLYASDNALSSSVRIAFLTQG
jgi:hypothetical protein